MTMAALSYDPMYPPQGDWTIDDLCALPEDGVRRELVDGVLIEMPAPGRVHQKIGMRLGAHLDDSCPDHYDVVQEVDVTFDRKNGRRPDITVTTFEAIASNPDPKRYRFSDVVLAVEIVSPSSQSDDRFAKPVLYAQAGIPYFWRIDTEPNIVVNTFTLDEELRGYVLDHEFTERIKLDKPWQIDIPFDQFVPRIR